MAVHKMRYVELEDIGTKNVTQLNRAIAAEIEPCLWLLLRGTLNGLQQYHMHAMAHSCVLRLHFFVSAGRWGLTRVAGSQSGESSSYWCPSAITEAICGSWCVSPFVSPGVSFRVADECSPCGSGLHQAKKRQDDDDDDDDDSDDDDDIQEEELQMEMACDIDRACHLVLDAGISLSTGVDMALLTKASSDTLQTKLEVFEALFPNNPSSPLIHGSRRSLAEILTSMGDPNVASRPNCELCLEVRYSHLPCGPAKPRHLFNEFFLNHIGTLCWFIKIVVWICGSAHTSHGNDGLADEWHADRANCG
jgi:hypothetical protein